ncbi:hypothetical protein K2173_011072 [Erythroxylum novogranatense]|uniref:NB-ARC domain-containing protein n=1 Tax=Erythroxylum novogranatense TaxID=1862640 RepID=A0AAV8TL84_9ROSI|nr:hypothetical protein K2173_011072 [Erythroxylum novogranatense]
MAAEDEIMPAPEAMGEKTVQDMIWNLLYDGTAKFIILHGEAGSGKTWTARFMSECAIREGLFDGALWLYLNKKYDKMSLVQSIASQLSLLCSGDELEDEEYNEEEMNKMEEGEQKNKENELQEKLEQKISELLGRKKYLLILDDEGSKMTQKEIEDILNSFIRPNQRQALRFLVIRRKSDSGEVTGELIELGGLSKPESLSLFETRAKFQVPECLSKAKQDILEKSKDIPAAIIVIAEALGYIAQHSSKEWTLKKAFERACEKVDDGVKDIFRCGYDMLPSSELKSCCWYSRQLFEKHGGFHYNELIACWIMEGYLGFTDCIKKGYMKGHRVLMEFIDRGMLKIQEDNIVTMEKKALEVTDDRVHGIGSTSYLGLANIYDEGEWNSLGKIVLADGMIKTVCNPKSWERLSTLLIDGNKLSDGSPDFFHNLKELKVLAVFQPRFRSVPSSLSNMEKLEVLVLRGCEMLDGVQFISNLKSLAVLEISDASSLREIGFNIFDSMTNLRSLNLSRVQITSLESPTKEHSKLRWLILKECSSLEAVPTLTLFENLEVLDTSGATQLKDINNGNLNSLHKLQLINFSQTKISTFPFVQQLSKLNQIFLCDCEELTRLPGLPHSLQTLDLSGCIKFSELGKTQKHYELKLLDLSRTPIEKLEKLPFLSRSLCSLILNGCEKITQFPSTSAVEKLEILDLSNAKNLVEFVDQSFSHLMHLRVLNLSNTKIEKVPSLSGLGNLCQLLLAGCLNLFQFPKMNDLVKIEILDISGCKALTGIPTQSFKFFSRLQQLNLSGTSNLKDFDTSFLKNMISLQIVNLSGVPLKVYTPTAKHLSESQLLPSTSSVSSQVSTFGTVSENEVKDSSESHIKGIPHEILELNSLKILTLSKLEDIEWGKIKCLPEEMHFDGLSIFKLGDVHAHTYEPSTSTCTTYPHFYICPAKEEGKEEIIRCDKEPFVRDIYYYLTRHAPHHETEDRFFEIHGFHSFPESFSNILKFASYVSFNDTQSLSSLSELGADNTRGIKVCWFDRCKNLQTIIHEEEKEARFGENLEILWISNLPHLETIYKGNLQVLNDPQYKVLQNLKCLFLDCCPKLTNIFTSSLLPESLEVLEIHFCDKLQTVFEHEKATELSLKKLHSLHLFELPELKSIGCVFPSLKCLKVEQCPMLSEIWPPSTQPPVDLEVLKVKSCDKLVTVFGDNSLEHKFHELHSLHLCELQELNSIGGVFPSLKSPKVELCPKLPEDILLDLASTRS